MSSLSVTPLFVVTRTMIIVLIQSLAIAGNGFVLWFYGKNKKLTGKVYIQALAVIDLVACLVILPQAILFELERGKIWPVFSYALMIQGTLQMVSTFGVQVTMALDQFIAVIWPFKHARLKKYLNRAMLSLAAILFLLLPILVSIFIALSMSKNGIVSVYAALAMVCLCALFIIYPATAYKLYRQSATVKPQPQLQLHSSAKLKQETSKQPQTTSPDARRMHVQALKIYIAILLQFILSSILSTMGCIIFERYWMLYFFYFNHVGNPVIYYCFVAKFREGVKKSAKTMCRRH